MFLLTLMFIILTVAFVEVKGIQTSVPYLAFTSIFYVITDGLFIDLFSQWSVLSKIPGFECREAIFAKLSLKIVAMILALALHFSLLLQTRKFKLFLSGLYINVYSRGKELLYNEISTLAIEENSVKKFRKAEPKDIAEYDDVCAICLAEMKQARVTRCQHFFHDHCLSLAVQSSNWCPK